MLVVDDDDDEVVLALPDVEGCSLVRELRRDQTLRGGLAAVLAQLQRTVDGPT